MCVVVPVIPFNPRYLTPHSTSTREHPKRHHQPALAFPLATVNWKMTQCPARGRVRFLRWPTTNPRKSIPYHPLRKEATVTMYSLCTRVKRKPYYSVSSFADIFSGCPLTNSLSRKGTNTILCGRCRLGGCTFGTRLMYLLFPLPFS